MNSDNILLLGLHHSVTAFSKTDGTVLWRTDLPTNLNGHEFVTLLSDGNLVFAHTEGELHCLDLSNGQLLWSNNLRGYGYGLATLCCPGLGSAPETAALQHQVLEEQRRRSSS